MRPVINAAPMVVVLIDEMGEVVLKNPAYLTLMTALDDIEPAKLMLGSAGESFGDREIRGLSDVLVDCLTFTLGTYTATLRINTDDGRITDNFVLLSNVRVK